MGYNVVLVAAVAAVVSVSSDGIGDSIAGRDVTIAAVASVTMVTVMSDVSAVAVSVAVKIGPTRHQVDDHQQHQRQYDLRTTIELEKKTGKVLLIKGSPAACS